MIRFGTKNLSEQLSMDTIAKNEPLWFINDEISNLIDNLTALQKRIETYKKQTDVRYPDSFLPLPSDYTEGDPVPGAEPSELRRRREAEQRKFALGAMKTANDTIKQYHERVKLIHKQ